MKNIILLCALLLSSAIITASGVIGISINGTNGLAPFASLFGGMIFFVVLFALLLDKSQD